MFGKRSIPVLYFYVAAAYLFYCLVFTPNFLITIPVVLFPAFAFRLLWVDGQPNVLFFGMMLQWLSTATQLLYCNFLNISLEEKMRSTVIPASKMEDATLLSMIALYFFAAGLYIAVRNIRFQDIESIIAKYVPYRVLLVYILFSLSIYATGGVIWNFSLIVQFIVFFFYLKWGFFLFTFFVLHRHNSRWRFLFYGFVMIEVLLSVRSFFAGEFLNISLFTLLAIVTMQRRFNLRSYVVIIMGTFLVLHFLIIWSAVKKDYRAYISKGQKAQTVLVSGEEAQEKFFSLVSTIDSKQYEEGINRLVDRLGYIQFFAASLDYVPRVVPFQNGEVYLAALEHNLVPRFINTSKEILDDSKHTTKFTGIQLSGRKEASSYSLGYIADAYIDFGPIFMHVMVFFIGLLFGLLYSLLVRRSKSLPWAWIVTAPFFILLNINGSDTKKVLGWLLIYFITIVFLQRFLIRLLDPIMLHPDGKKVG